MYIAGWNQPGYLPESDPATFDDFADAKGYILDEMQNYSDELFESEEEATGGKADDVEQAGINAQHERGPFEVRAGGYVFWVVKAG